MTLLFAVRCGDPSIKPGDDGHEDMEQSMRKRLAHRDEGGSSRHVTLSDTLIQGAEAPIIDMTQACEHGLAKTVDEARWLQENRPAMDAWNEYVERNGLPLAEFRRL